VPGDRQNKSIEEVGKISGECFDYIYIKEDKDKRGRVEGEVADLLLNGVLSSGFNKKSADIILDEKEALKSAIDNSNDGDIIIVFFEEYLPLLDLVKDKINELSVVPEIGKLDQINNLA